MNGIPDPGRASKAVEMVTTAAPFDAIRNVTLEGREFWSARDLMSPLGYTTWENFAEAIGRAKVAAHNSVLVKAAEIRELSQRLADAETARDTANARASL